MIANDRYEEAFQGFIDSHAESADPDDMTSVHAEFELIRAQIIHEKHNAVKFSDLFANKTLRRRTMVGFLTMIGGQAAGTQVVNSMSMLSSMVVPGWAGADEIPPDYGPSLYAGLGYGTTQTLLIQCGWITSVAIGNIINASIIDKVGRKPVFCKSSLRSLQCCILLTKMTRLWLWSLRGFDDRRMHCRGHLSTQWQSRCSVCGCVVFVPGGLLVSVDPIVMFCPWRVDNQYSYASTLDATTYIYASEVFPTPMRAKGMAVSVSGLFIGALTTLMPAPTAFANIRWKYFLVFVCASTAMLIVVHFIFPEVSH